MEDLIIKYTGKGKAKTANLTFQNECTVFNIESIYEKIIEESKKNKFSTITIKDISNIDLAGVQLFIALQKQFEHDSLNVKFEFILSDDLKNILTNSGFKDIIHN